MTTFAFTYAQLAACAAREAALRRRVYAKRFGMPLDFGHQREIAMMETIRDHFDSLGGLRVELSHAQRGDEALGQGQEGPARPGKP